MSARASLLDMWSYSCTGLCCSSPLSSQLQRLPLRDRHTKMLAPARKSKTVSVHRRILLEIDCQELSIGQLGVDCRRDMHWCKGLPHSNPRTLCHSRTYTYEGQTFEFERLVGLSKISRLDV